MFRDIAQPIKLALLLSALASAPATQAQEKPAAAKTPQPQEWLAPAITQYGKIRPYPNAAVQLQPEQSYQVLFNVTKAAPGDDEVVPGLERAARFVNLASLADVPDKNLQIVAVLHGPATAAVLADEAYLKRYQRKNPNRELIAALNKAGVTVMVCGQALAHQDFATSEVASDVTVAVAALTVLAQYQSAGYALMPN